MSMSRIDFWQRREIWTAAGSATGFREPKVVQEPGDVDIGKVADKVGRLWTKLARLRGKDPVSYAKAKNQEQAGNWVSKQTMNTLRRLGVETSRDGQVSKRSALELLLWEAVVETLKGVPSGMVSAARKFEDSKERLLLTLDTLHFVVYSLVLHGAEPGISHHESVDHIAERNSCHSATLQR